MIQARIERLLASMAREELDALVVSHPANRRYLSGFTGSDLPPLDSAGHLIVSPGGLWLVTDFRYAEQAQAECTGYQLVIREDSLAQAVTQVLLQAGCRRVGFEANHLIFSIYQQMLSQAGQAFELVATEGMVEQLRLVKEPGELELIRKAVHIADAALQEGLRGLRPGVTERALARTLENLMREMGAERPAFETIVASGPRAALPHARPEDRPIGLHEPVIVDMGACYAGYNSDMTRSLFLGGPDEYGRRLYRLVLQAQQVAEEGLRAGLTGREADGLARSLIEKEGFGQAFGHGLGHGIGLEVHEAPRLSRRSNDVLEAGSTVTVEPGIYITGWGGLRIEDLVVLQDQGVEVLTQSPKPRDGDISEVTA